MLRFIGRVILLAGIAVLAADIWSAIQVGNFRLSALGEWWSWAFGPNSIALIQAGIQRHLFPELWDYGVLRLMLWPAAVEFIVLGAILMFLGRKRERPRGREALKFNRR